MCGLDQLTGVKAIEEPPSLVDLRERTTAMPPRVELPEAFTVVSGGRSRLQYNYVLLKMREV